MSLATFEPFGLTHLAAVLGIVVVWVVIIAVARRLTPPQRRAFEIGFAAVTMGLWLWVVVWALMPPRFHPAYSLPIHICDLVAFLIPIAFVVRRRWMLSLIYFWGVGLSLQAVITPVLHVGPAYLDFWLFWGHHALAVGAAAYMIIIHGYRPTWRDMGLAIAFGVLYVAIIMPVNIAFDYNYAFIGDRLPSQPTLLDHLGSWPWRVGVVAVLVVVAMVILELPWALANRQRTTR